MKKLKKTKKPKKEKLQKEKKSKPKTKINHMIMKVIVTYEDGSEATFEGTPAVAAAEAVPAKGVDLTTIPLEPTPKA